MTAADAASTQMRGETAFGGLRSQVIAGRVRRRAARGTSGMEDDSHSQPSQDEDPAGENDTRINVEQAMKDDVETAAALSLGFRPVPALATTKAVRFDRSGWSASARIRPMSETFETRGSRFDDKEYLALNELGFPPVLEWNTPEVLNLVPGLADFPGYEARSSGRTISIDQWSEESYLLAVPAF